MHDYEMRMYGDVQNRIIKDFKLTPETVNDIKNFEHKWNI